MKTCNFHTKIPNSRKQIRKNTNLEMRNSKAFWVLFSSVCTNVNKKGRQKMSALFIHYLSYCIQYVLMINNNH